MLKVFGLRFVMAIACVVAWHASATAADKRVALVIGNSAYAKATRLSNPTRDAAAIGTVLGKAGFTVTKALDVDNVSMRRKLREFSRSASDADIAIVYFAGHGIEIRGSNYLIPIDAALERDIDVEDETVALDRVLQLLTHTKRLRLVILDACRDNPFVPNMQRSGSSRTVGRGLAKIEVQISNTLVAYAARAGSTAADGSGSNSPYTKALVQHLTTPGLDVRLALGRVRDEVIKSTESAQEPFVYGSLGGAEISLTPPIGVSQSSIEAIGKRFLIGSRAGNEVTVVEAFGIDGAAAMAIGIQLRDDVIDLCANARQFDPGTPDFKSCITSEQASTGSDRFMIKANCLLGHVHFEHSTFPFVLPERSKKDGNCLEPGFWETKGAQAVERLPWQTAIQLTSAFKVLCPANARKWNLMTPARQC